MTKKILVATEKPFAKEAIDLMKGIVAKHSGYKLELLENYTDAAQLKDAVKDADALIVRSDKATKEVLEAGKNLKIVVRAGAGYDNIDLAAATACNIVAMNTPGQNSNAVAELSIGMMIMSARNNYNGKSGTEIKGKSLGIYGLGNIGKLTAQYAKAFGMTVNVYVRNYEKYKADIEELGLNYCDSVAKLFETSQYVSLCIPASAETKASVNYDLLSKMPQGACLVNTARKELIDEEALKKLMAERSDFRYASDVAPDCAAELKEKYGDRVFFTPKKLGAQTEEANINAGVAAVEQIIRFFDKGDVTFKVN